MDYVAFYRNEKHIIEKIEETLGVKFTNISGDEDFVYVGVKSYSFGDVIRKLRSILTGVIQDKIDTWA